MGINSDAMIFTHLEPHFDRIWVALKRSGKRYDSSPDKIIHSLRTKASYLNDCAFTELVSEWDEVPGIRPHFDRRSNGRFISVDDVILLWIKKVNFVRVVSNYLTPHAIEMLDEQATFDFAPHASVIVLGYQFNEVMELRRVSFSPPSRSRPAWYVDLEPGDTTVIEMPSPGSQPIRPSGLRVTRSGTQMIFKN